MDTLCDINNVTIDIAGTEEFAGAEEVSRAVEEATRVNESLNAKAKEGAMPLGWLGLPAALPAGLLGRIEEAAYDLRGRAETIVVAGIGGSYLGAKAVRDAVSHYFPPAENDPDPEIIYAGHTLSEDYMGELLGYLHTRSFAVIVISKSGTTMEPAVALRFLKKAAEERYGKEGAASRIIAVTDAREGALRALADTEGYRTFDVPDDVGGRYSVLTPVGLLPLSAAGVDIRELIRGAKDMMRRTSPDAPHGENPALRYAALRNILYGKGLKIEILAVYEPRLRYLCEWWKQLFGESEGKDGKGIFPASVVNTADLHSMGQYIQDGERRLFETVISIAEPERSLAIEASGTDGDGLNYLAGKRLGEVNRMAELGVRMAHIEGGVPNIRILVPRLTPYHIGGLLYFFELSCAISGTMLGVNPFDQPSVEAYKENMVSLLGKPGCGNI